MPAATTKRHATVSNPLLLKPFRPSGMGTASAASIIASDPSISTSGPAMFFRSAPNIIIMITTQYHPCHAAISAVAQGERGRETRGGQASSEKPRAVGKCDYLSCSRRVFALTSLARGSAGVSAAGFEDARAPLRLARDRNEPRVPQTAVARLRYDARRLSRYL
jgi:hypothetical protein